MLLNTDIKRKSLNGVLAQVLNGMRSECVVDTNGHRSEMVWIPRFTVPAQTLGAWPDVPLNLGGFWIDKYQCAHNNASPEDAGNGAVPVSRAGLVPWASITRADAITACAGRIINGFPVLPTMDMWAALTIIPRLIGHALRGNNFSGRDYRDANTWSNAGVDDPTDGNGRCLTGTGPDSWSTNNLPSGVMDLIGNLYEWVDFSADYGRYRKVRTALVADDQGITAGDPDVTLGTVQDLAGWPTANGIILIKAEGANTDEAIRYATLVDNGNGTVTLGGLTRGYRGTAASAHADGADVECWAEYCILPKAYSGFTDGLNNVTDPVTFDILDYRHASAAAPAVNDILQVGSEQLLVTAGSILGDTATVTATRAYNGTVAAQHADWTPIVRHSPDMLTFGTPQAPYQRGYVKSFRLEPDLLALMLPNEITTDPNAAELEDVFGIYLATVQFCARGGDVTSSNDARNGWATKFFTGASAFVGFRAAFRLVA